MQQLDAMFRNPRPWLPQAAIDFLSRNARKDDIVLEFGGGTSSLWSCRLVRHVHTVEADHEWAARLLIEAGKDPEVLKNWSLRFVPCNWNPSLSYPKDYWKEHKEKITEADSSYLEEIYSKIWMNPSVIVVDGSIRPTTLRAAARFASENPLRMFVLDNLETMEKYLAPGMFAGMTRFDFFETNPARIPKHQNGVWNTAVWIRDDVTS